MIKSNGISTSPYQALTVLPPSQALFRIVTLATEDGSAMSQRKMEDEED